MQTDVDAHPAIDLFYDLDQLQLADKAVGSDHIHVALVELAVASFLRTVCAPNRLDLEPLEGERDLLTVLYHIACKRNGQVVPQTFLRRKSGFLSAVLDAEEQLVAFLAVFAHQRPDILHCRSLDLLKTVQTKHTFDRVKDIIAARHLDLSEVTRAFGYTWFLCHKSQIINYKLKICSYIFRVAPFSDSTYCAAQEPISS